jgi:Family of unknown function (DUF6567)
MRARVLCLVVPLLCLATGCVYSGTVIGMVKGKAAEASAKDYTVVKPNLRAEASCSYLFGLIPLGSSAVATQAMDKLGAAANVDGKSIGLVNFTGHEEIASYFGIFARRSVSLQADAVELPR